MWPLCEHVLGDGHRRKDVGPADIEGEMSDDLRNLSRLHPVIERKIEMIWHLDGLIACDQRCQCDNAAVTRCEAGAFPHVAEETLLRVSLQRRGNLTNIPIR